MARKAQIEWTTVAMIIGILALMLVLFIWGRYGFTSKPFTNAIDSILSKFGF